MLGLGSNRVVVQLETSWVDWLTAALPSVLAAAVAVAVVYLSGRMQAGREELQFRKNLRLDLYRRGLALGQAKLYEFYKLADLAVDEQVSSSLEKDLRDNHASLRLVDAECAALASPAFRELMSKITALEPPQLGLTEEERMGYKSKAESSFELLSSVVRGEFGLVD